MRHRENKMHEKVKRRKLEVAGIRVFKSKNRFHHWLNMPCRALGDKVPAKYAETEEGYQQVLDELGRIEYGVYS